MPTFIWNGHFILFWQVICLFKVTVFFYIETKLYFCAKNVKDRLKKDVLKAILPFKSEHLTKSAFPPHLFRSSMSLCSFTK